jgi:hypothetical protein
VPPVLANKPGREALADDRSQYGKGPGLAHDSNVTA